LLQILCVLQTSALNEFHVPIRITGSIQYHHLHDLCNDLGVHLSVLVGSKSVSAMKVFTTMRFYDRPTTAKALECLENWLQWLKKAGMPVSGHVHKEVCLYDDNVALDEGWMAPPPETVRYPKRLHVFGKRRREETVDKDSDESV
jgi:hypothetical protein